MTFDLHKATIFLLLTGSRGYGTNHETSDWDYRGIAIPPLDSYIGIKPKFEQSVDTDKSKHVWKNYPEGLVEKDADMQVMEICKFAKLATDCNPSIIEILFSDESSFVLKHSIADRLLENKELFLSKRAKARFCGYALAQLKRIKRHKKWFDSPLDGPPSRLDFGLPDHGVISADQIGAAESLIKKEVDQFMIAQDDLPEHTKIELNNSLEKMMRAVWTALHDVEFPVGEGKFFNRMDEALTFSIMEKEGYSENFILTLTKERKYRAAQKEWESYITWKNERNEARAELEKKFSFDTKHGMHLVRLLRMAREIIETGKVHVRRPDAEELLAIRNGAWSYEKMVEFAEGEDEVLYGLLKTSPLRSHPDEDKIHSLIHNMVMEFNGK